MTGHFFSIPEILVRWILALRFPWLRLKRFIRDERGVSAVEFAVLLPVMVLIYAGVADVSRGVDANRKVSRIASVVGDLVSRQISIMPAQLDDIFTIGATIMGASRVTPEIRVSFLKVEKLPNSQTLIVKLDWSQKTAGFTESRNQTEREKRRTHLPENLRQEVMNYIRVETQYVYEPLLAAVLPPINMEEIYYISPRYSDSIRYGKGE